MGICVLHACLVLPEEKVVSPRTGVLDGWVPLSWVLKIEHNSSRRTASAHKGRAISHVPGFNFYSY